MSVLPKPDEIALAHSKKLRELLTARIESDGPISFARYMEQALYEPGLGYYMAGASKFGGQGDFITAPEVSPLYGSAIAQEAHAVLAQTGGGILELGAGSGLLALSLIANLPTSSEVTYSILEPSAELIQRQQDLLQAQLSVEQFRRVQWLDTLPVDFTGVVLANEVMDALPVQRFVAGDPLQQIFLDKDLQPFNGVVGDDLQKAIAAIEADLGVPFVQGYTSEVCLLLKPWLAGLGHCLKHGVILLIDYGYPRREYYLPERNEGTLACYYQHRAHHDALLWPGLQDITAHVDFTAVAEAAVDNDLDLLGYASQSAFLLDNNLLALADQQMATAEREVDRIAISRAVKTLTLPGEMGERFQVMALGKGYDASLNGFLTQDLSHRL